MNITVNVTGDKALVAKMGSQLYAVPVSKFFRKSGKTIHGLATDEVPRWDGNLANSIETEFDYSIPMRFVRVGTNADYAAPAELGSQPHFPPVDAITPWAETHGIDPWALAYHIAAVGTKPHPFLEPALEDSKPDIKRYLAEMANDIERQAATS